MPLWLRTLVKLTPVVAVWSLAGGLAVVAFRAIAPTGDLDRSSNDIGNYLQTVGSIYAVLLAFVVFVVWGQFNEARGLIDREASALVDLHRTASGLPNDTRVSIQSHLRDYVEAVLRDEWHAMAKQDEATFERIGHLLDEVWVAIHQCRPTTICEQTMYSEVLSRFNDVTDVRTTRLTSSRFRIPLTMKILLYAGAVIVIGSMCMVIIEPLWAHVLVTAALAGAIGHILYLIHDLDALFEGTVVVDNSPFLRARAAFDRVVHLIPDSCCE